MKERLQEEKSQEVHLGRVERMDEDFTYVTITKPDGQQYRRAFVTEVFREAGIETGNDVQLTFNTEVGPGEVNVNLQIKDSGPALNYEEVAAEIRGVMKDLDLIRQKFGSHR